MNCIRKIIRNSFLTVTCLVLVVACVHAQGSKSPDKPASSKSMEITDSLQQIIDTQEGRIDALDSVLQAERQTSGELREQVIRIDDYRKKLEANINSFKGENLKLNQSNRILIVFNSLVAVLLIISLVFFIRKIGQKRTGTTVSNNNTTAKSGEKMKFTSFDDKLQHLERLGKLREKALLSEEEFLIEKQRILGKQ